MEKQKFVKRKRMIDARCLQVRLIGQGATMLGVGERRHKLWWSRKRMELVE